MKNMNLTSFDFILVIALFSFSKALLVHNIARDYRKSVQGTRRYMTSDQPKAFFATDDSIVARDSLLPAKEVLKFYRDGHLQVKGLFDRNFVQNKLAPSLKKYYEANKLSALRIKAKVTLGREDADDMTLEECEAALKLVDPEEIPFMNVFNCWIENEETQKVVLSPKLGQIVAELLGTVICLVFSVASSLLPSPNPLSCSFTSHAPLTLPIINSCFCALAFYGAGVPAVRVYQDALFIKRSGDGPTRWHSDLNMAPFDTNDFLTCWIPLQSVPPQAEGGSSLSFATGSHRDFALPYCK
jgi:hypothetical protein